MTRTSATSKGVTIYAGTGTIAAASSSVLVYNTHMTLTANVQVTMTADMTPAVRMWVSNKSGAATNWYDSNWTYRKKITIDNTKVDADLTDFPVLINLSSDADLAAGARSDAYDILFTASDGTTKRSHEIEKYVTGTGELVAWVKVPALSSTADTELYMYYGYATATDQQDVVNVWDANYVMVQHMKDITTSTIEDSTANNNDGTKLAANEPIETTSGEIGNAQDFDGVDDVINCGSDTSLDGLAAQTISSWIYVDTQQYGGVISKGDYAASSGYEILTRLSDDQLQIVRGDGADKMVHQTPVDSLLPGAWHHITLAFTNTNAAPYIYIDGVLQTLTEAYTFAGTVNDAGYDLLIGDRVSTNFDGEIDEVRISNIIRTGTWISTEYNNQSSPSTFYSVGSEEEELRHFTVNTDVSVTNDSTFDYLIKA